VKRETASRLRWNHSLLARVIEQAAGIDHWPHLAQGFEQIGLACRLNCDGRFVEIDGDNVAGFEKVAQAIQAFARVEFASSHAISKENTREALGEDDLAASRAQRDGRVLTGTAATEVFSANDNRIFAVQQAWFNEARRVK
jgi:hypothetical protein